jgi:DNA-binding LacI/PurR family transcriptional regulator
MTKLKDVAEKASVSLATASLALSDSTLISIKSMQ